MNTRAWWDEVAVAGPEPMHGRAHRRRAAAVATWFSLAAGGLPHVDASGALGLPDPLLPVANRRTDDDRPDMPPALADALGSCLMNVGAQPRRFRAELDEAHGRIAYRGVLLPFGDETGAVIAVMATWDGQAVAPAKDRPMLADPAVALALACTPQPVPACAWNDALPAADRPIQADLLGQARLWAALASTGPARRTTALHAAIGLAYQMLHGRDPIPDPEQVIEAVFGSHVPPSDRTMFADLLARARRLGIGSTGLSALLDRMEHGIAAFLGVPDPATSGIVELPIAPGFLELEPLASAEARAALCLANAPARRAAA